MKQENRMNNVISAIENSQNKAKSKINAEQSLSDDNLDQRQIIEDLKNTHIYNQSKLTKLSDPISGSSIDDFLKSLEGK